MCPPYSRKLFCCLPPGQCYHVPCSLEPSPEKRKQHLEQPAQVGPTRTAPLAGPPARHRPGDRCHFPALGCGTRSQGSRKGKARRGRETTAPGGPAGRVPALGLAGLSLSLYKPGRNLQSHPHHFKPSKYFLFLPTVYIFQMLAGLLEFP